MTTGRNDPCPCGSGLKYKKCCQPKQDVISLEGVRADNLFREVLNKLSDFMGNPASGDAVGAGFAHFFVVPLGEEEEKEVAEQAMDWVAFAYRTDNGTTLCEQLAADGKRLTDQEREVLRGWKAAVPGFFRVEAAGQEYRLSRLPDGRAFSVRTQGIKLKAGDMVSAWLLPVLSTYQFGYLTQDIPPEALAPLTHLLEIEMSLLHRQRPGATWDELYREHWPRLIDMFTLAVADGENAFRVLLPPGPSVLTNGEEPAEADPRWQEVGGWIRQGMNRLDDTLSEGDVQGALRLWRDGALALQPRVGRPGSWAAGVIYLYMSDVLGEDVTQAEVAEACAVSAATVGKYSRELASALNPGMLDPRYADLMGPHVRMHWRMDCLAAMRDGYHHYDDDDYDDYDDEGDGPFAPQDSLRTPLEQVFRELERGRRGERPDGPIRRAEELIDQAWEASGSKRARLAEAALKLWPDAADAYVLRGKDAEASGKLQEARKLYEAGVQAGERTLGAEFFAENVGHFYGLVESRPYMRARAALAGCLWALGEREAALAHYEEMLRLNPGDNQGIRYLLVACYLTMGDDARLGILLGRYADEPTAAIAFTRALWQYRQSGPGQAADNLLAEALASNPHVTAYLLGEKRLPPEPPAYIDLGGDLEAKGYAWEFREGWQRSKGALDWLRSRARSL